MLHSHATNKVFQSPLEKFSWGKDSVSPQSHRSHVGRSKRRVTVKLFKTWWTLLLIKMWVHLVWFACKHLFMKIFFLYITGYPLGTWCWPREHPSATYPSLSKEISCHQHSWWKSCEKHWLVGYYYIWLEIAIFGRWIHEGQLTLPVSVFIYALWGFFSLSFLLIIVIFTTS